MQISLWGSPLSGLVLYWPKFLPGVERGLRKPFSQKSNISLLLHSMQCHFNLTQATPFSFPFFLIGQEGFLVLFFKRAWSGTPESFHPTPQGLSEAPGQCGIWQVNCHASTLARNYSKGHLPCAMFKAPSPNLPWI